MVCHVTITRESGDYLARAAEYPEVTGRGATREIALANLRESIRFWLEACPCDTTADMGLRLEVVREQA